VISQATSTTVPLTVTSCSLARPRLSAAMPDAAGAMSPIRRAKRRRIADGNRGIALLPEGQDAEILVVPVDDALVADDFCHDEIVDAVTLVPVGVGDDLVGLDVDDRRIGDDVAGTLDLEEDIDLAVLALDADRNAPDGAPDSALVMRGADPGP